MVAILLGIILCQFPSVIVLENFEQKEEDKTS